MIPKKTGQKESMNMLKDVFMKSTTRYMNTEDSQIASNPNIKEQALKGLTAESKLKPKSNNNQSEKYVYKPKPATVSGRKLQSANKGQTSSIAEKRGIASSLGGGVLFQGLGLGEGGSTQPKTRATMPKQQRPINPVLQKSPNLGQSPLTKNNNQATQQSSVQTPSDKNHFERNKGGRKFQSKSQHFTPEANKALAYRKDQQTQQQSNSTNPVTSKGSNRYVYNPIKPTTRSNLNRSSNQTPSQSKNQSNTSKQQLQNSSLTVKKDEPSSRSPIRTPSNRSNRSSNVDLDVEINTDTNMFTIQLKGGGSSRGARSERSINSIGLQDPSEKQKLPTGQTVKKPSANAASSSVNNNQQQCQKEVNVGRNVTRSNIKEPSSSTANKYKYGQQRTTTTPAGVKSVVQTTQYTQETIITTEIIETTEITQTFDKVTPGKKGTAPITGANKETASNASSGYVYRKPLTKEQLAKQTQSNNPKTPAGSTSKDDYSDPTKNQKPKVKVQFDQERSSINSKNVANNKTNNPYTTPAKTESQTPTPTYPTATTPNQTTTPTKPAYLQRKTKQQLATEAQKVKPQKKQTTPAATIAVPQASEASSSSKPAPASTPGKYVYKPPTRKAPTSSTRSFIKDSVGDTPGKNSDQKSQISQLSQQSPLKSHQQQLVVDTNTPLKRPIPGKVGVTASNTNVLENSGANTSVKPTILRTTTTRNADNKYTDTTPLEQRNVETKEEERKGKEVENTIITPAKPNTKETVTGTVPDIGTGSKIVTPATNIRQNPINQASLPSTSGSRVKANQSAATENQLKPQQQEEISKEQVYSQCAPLLALILKRRVGQCKKHSFNKLKTNSDKLHQKQSLYATNLLNCANSLSSRIQTRLTHAFFQKLKKSYLQQLDSEATSQQQIQSQSRAKSISSKGMRQSQKRQKLMQGLQSKTKHILCFTIASLVNRKIKQSFLTQFKAKRDNQQQRKSHLICSSVNLVRKKQHKALKESFRKIKFYYNVVQNRNDSDILPIFESKKAVKTQLTKFMDNLFKKPLQQSTSNSRVLKTQLGKPQLINTPQKRQIISSNLSNQSKAANLTQKPLQQKPVGLTPQQKAFEQKIEQIKKQIALEESKLNKQNEKIQSKKKEMQQQISRLRKSNLLKKRQKEENQKKLDSIEQSGQNNNLYYLRSKELTKEGDDTERNIQQGRAEELLQMMSEIYVSVNSVQSENVNLEQILLNRDAYLQESPIFTTAQLIFTENPPTSNVELTDTILKSQLSVELTLIQEQNKRIKDKIYAYEKAILTSPTAQNPSLKKTEVKIQEEIQTVKKLVQSYVKERYLWQWVRRMIREE